MDFKPIIDELREKGQAGRRYEREGHGRFRDCLTVCRSGRLLFERFCYGEAAGLVFSVWAEGPGTDGAIEWKDCPGGGEEALPQRLTGIQQDGALELDGQKKLWRAVADQKRVKGESGRLFGWFSQKRKKSVF